MATSSAFDFATDISAKMAGMSSENYVSRMNDALTMLDKIEGAIGRMKLKTENDFKQAHDIKSVLCSLSCYTSNNKLPENDRVWKLESVLGAKMHKWTMRNLAKPDDNLLIRYILWNKRYAGDSETRKWILDQLIEKGFLGIRPAGQYNTEEIVLTGIACKVGDNVFSIGRDDREYRNYCTVCLPQCFFPTWAIDTEYVKSKSLPTLDPDLSMTYMRDGKGCARHPKITSKDRRRLKEIVPAHLASF